MRGGVIGALCCAMVWSFGCVSDDAGGGPWVVEGGSADGWSTPSVLDPGEDAYLWQVRHAWADAAPGGGTYEDLYASWVREIRRRDFSIVYTYPDGSTVPPPNLECADTAMFLRFFFASEFGLPMIVRVGSTYYGHFGVIGPEGPQDDIGGWDYDAIQSYPSGSSTTRQYLDEVVGRDVGGLLLELLNEAGSVTLADELNTYYVDPAAIREGDLQLHRFPHGGLGHAITVQSVSRTSQGTLREVMLMASTMPSYPRVYNGYEELTSAIDTEYGGGLRRWRTPVLRDGRWYLEADSAVAISAAAASHAPETFAQLFGLSPEGRKEAALEAIATLRDQLIDHPASCRLREEREEAFESLYALYGETLELRGSLGLSTADSYVEVREAVDRAYRTVEDFIWAEMMYEQSWVCHWNPQDASINRDMYRAAVELNREALARGGCEALRVFRAEGVDAAAGADGFGDLASYARGNGFQWEDYFLDPSEGDEGGALRTVVTDEVARTNLVEYFCRIYDSVYFAPDPLDPSSGAD